MKAGIDITTYVVFIYLQTVRWLYKVIKHPFLACSQITSFLTLGICLKILEKISSGELRAVFKEFKLIINKIYS